MTTAETFSLTDHFIVSSIYPHDGGLRMNLKTEGHHRMTIDISAYDIKALKLFVSRMDEPA